MYMKVSKAIFGCLFFGVLVMGACEKRYERTGQNASAQEMTNGGEAAAAVMKAKTAELQPPVVAQAKPVVTRDKAIETAEYTLSLQIPDEVTIGDPTTVNVVLESATGWKLNKEFPTRLTVAPPSGVDIVKTSMGMADAKKVEKKAAGGKEDSIVSVIFPIQFTAEATGEKDFAGLFRFAVCTDATCNPKTADLSFVIDVKPAG